MCFHWRAFACRFALRVTGAGRHEADYIHSACGFLFAAVPSCRAAYRRSALLRSARFCMLTAASLHFSLLHPAISRDLIALLGAFCGIPALVPSIDFLRTSGLFHHLPQPAPPRSSPRHLGVSRQTSSACAALYVRPMPISRSPMLQAGMPFVSTCVLHDLLAICGAIASACNVRLSSY